MPFGVRRGISGRRSEANVHLCSSRSCLGKPVRRGFRKRVLRDNDSRPHGQLGPHHVATLEVKMNLANLLQSLRAPAAAKVLYDTVMADRTDRRGPHSVSTFCKEESRGSLLKPGGPGRRERALRNSDSRLRMPARTTAYSNCAQAWNDLGVIGGGIISGRTNSETECYQRL